MVDHIGVTATQRGLTEQQKLKARNLLSVVKIFHHGDCIGGDYDLHCIVRDACPTAVITCHPPIKEDKRAWTLCEDRREPKEYRLRNHDIVVESHLLIAFPGETFEIQRSGTWMTVRMARRERVNVLVVWPDGSVGPGNTPQQCGQTNYTRISA